jgi:hypothetical protein
LLSVTSFATAQDNPNFTYLQLTTTAKDHKWPAINNSGDRVWCLQSGGFWKVVKNDAILAAINTGNDHMYPVIDDAGNVLYYELPSGQIYSTRDPVQPIEKTYCIATTADVYCASAGRYFGVASDGTTVTYFDWSTSYHGARWLRIGADIVVSGLDVGFVGDYPDVNDDGLIVYSSGGNVLITSAQNPSVSYTVEAGSQPRIADGPQSEIVYIKNGQVVSTVGGVVDTGIWADVNNKGQILYEKQVNGFSQIFLAQRPVMFFTAEPDRAHPGTPFGIQPVITVQDGGGAVDAAYNGPVTLSLQSGTGTPGATLGGTLTVNAVNGVARFYGISVDKAGTAYILVASSGSLTPSQSQPFTAAGPATQVTFTNQPGGGSGPILNPQPVLAVEDAGGNVVSDYTGNVTIAIRLGTGAPGAVLNGNPKVAVLNGVAIYTDLAINRPGSGFVLTASSGTLTPADSAAFSVSAIPTRLGFIQQPSGGQVQTPLSPRLVATILDGTGNTVPSFNGPVSVALTPGAGTPGAILGGNTTVGAVNGIATFTDLSIDRAGTGYVLAVTSGALLPATSAPFAIGSASGAYTVPDVIIALQIAVGSHQAATSELSRLNVATQGTSASKVDIADATRLLRKIDGLEPNP